MTAPPFVLDSFALLAFFQDEPGADAVSDLLLRARKGDARLAITVVNLAEMVYRTLREHGIARAQEVLARIEEYGIEVVEVDRDLALAAAHLKGSYRIAYADCLAAALAQRLDATIVTGDPDFAQVEGLVRVQWLPHGHG